MDQNTPIDEHPLAKFAVPGGNFSTGPVCYLPLNTTRVETAACLPTHALIDAELLPLVVPYNWTTTPTGQVIARVYEPQVSAAERRVIHTRLVLTDFVQGIEQQSPKSGQIVHRNGDSLDCRKANLQLVDRNGDHYPRYRPGSSFVGAPSFGIARSVYFEKAVPAYREHFRKGRKPTVLTREEVAEFLKDVLDESLPYGTMPTRELVKSYFHDGLGNDRVTAQLVSDILAGRAMVQPGIDYNHPRIRWRTRAATRARRAELLLAQRQQHVKQTTQDA